MCGQQDTRRRKYPAHAGLALPQSRLRLGVQAMTGGPAPGLRQPKEAIMIANIRVLVTVAVLVSSGVLSAAPQSPSVVPNAPSSCQVWAGPFFGMGPYVTDVSWSDNSDNETGFELQWKTSKPKDEGSITVGPNQAH